MNKGWGQTVTYNWNTASPTASGNDRQWTWTVPANVTSMTIECYGGGGGGGKISNANNGWGGAGGGGGGAYSKKTYNSSPPTGNLTIIVGRGGPGATTGANGTTGGTTSVSNSSGTLCSAVGGTGGTGGTGTGNNYSGGAGGLASSSVGDAGSKFNGGSGSGGAGSNGSTYNHGGGGGGCGGSTGVGSGGATGTGAADRDGGAGGGGDAGKGGKGACFNCPNRNAATGVNYGSGGGGGARYKNTSTNFEVNGADGIAGFVRITYTVCNVAAISLTSGSSPQTICPGNSITNIVYTYSGEATGASVTNLPAGLSSSVNTTNKTVTISGTPTASGTFTVTTTGHTCGNAASINGTVNSGFALPANPTAAGGAWGSGSGGSGSGCDGSGPGISAANPFIPTSTHYNLCAAWPGDWIFISVTAGDTYEFLTSSNGETPDVTAYVYLTNQGGTSVYASAEGMLTWKATTTEVIRFYIQDPTCARVESDRRRWVKKVTPTSTEINYSGTWGWNSSTLTQESVPSYFYGNEGSLPKSV